MKKIEHTNKKTFPIKTTCSQCGHGGDLFISDETIAQGMDEATRAHAMKIYMRFVARRFIALCALIFLCGLVIGWRLG